MRLWTLVYCMQFDYMVDWRKIMHGFISCKLYATNKYLTWLKVEIFLFKKFKIIAISLDTILKCFNLVAKLWLSFECTTNYNLFITDSLISVRIDFLLFLKDNLFISYTRFSFFSLCKKQKISWHKKSTKYIGMPLTFHLSDVYKVECLVMSFAYNIIFKNALSHIFTKNCLYHRSKVRVA